MFDFKSDPSRCQNTTNVAVCKHGYVSIALNETSHKSIGSHANIRGRFTVWASVTEEIPVRTKDRHICMRFPFVITIIPFGQVVIDHQALRQSGESGCLLCAKQRAAINLIERNRLNAFTQLPSFFFAVFSQGDIGSASVLPRQRPSGFTVPHQINTKFHRKISL